MEEHPASLSRCPVDRDARHLSRRDVLRGLGAGVAGAVAGLPLAAAARQVVSLPAAPAGTALPSMIVAPNPVAVDARFNVRLAGLTPGQPVTLHAETTDDEDLIWSSAATFRADAHGKIDLAKQAPISGSYSVADPMGLIWSALPPQSNIHNPQGYTVSVVPQPWTITSELGGMMVASASLTRQLLTPRVKMTQLNNHGLYGNLFQPVQPAPAPAVIVFGGSEGDLSLYVIREAILLARHGFAALALAYFGDPGLPDELAYIPLEYFGKAISWLQKQPGVRGDRLAVMGSSVGGELAPLLGTIYSQIEAVISYVGSGLVFSFLPTGQPTWTYRGKPVPSIPFTALAHNFDPSNYPWAVIPVERINGPLMLIAAADDREWPSVMLSKIAWDRLKQHHHPFPDEFHHYANAGHLLDAPYLPTATLLDFFGGTPQGMAFADADSWPRVINMLTKRLMR